MALLDLRVARAWQKERRDFRLLVRVTERTIDRQGQHRLLPHVSLEGGWTRLEAAPRQVIDCYAKHGTHEQFHSETKTDLDLERLPSGEFGC